MTRAGLLHWLSFLHDYIQRSHEEIMVCRVSQIIYVDARSALWSDKPRDLCCCSALRHVTLQIRLAFTPAGGTQTEPKPLRTHYIYRKLASVCSHSVAGRFQCRHQTCRLFAVVARSGIWQTTTLFLPPFFQPHPSSACESTINILSVMLYFRVHPSGYEVFRSIPLPLAGSAGYFPSMPIFSSHLVAATSTVLTELTAVGRSHYGSSPCTSSESCCWSSVGW